MKRTFAVVVLSAVPLLRLVLAAAIALSIATISLPGYADVSPHHQQKCCCNHTEQQNLGDGCGEPMKPAPDPQCCNGCPIGLAIASAEAKVRIFATPDGERLSVEDFFQASRTDRPPVPPPRALLFG